MGLDVGQFFFSRALQRGVMSVGYCLDVVVHEGALTSGGGSQKMS